MDDRWNQEEKKDQDRGRNSLSGVVMLGIVTAAVIGSVLFSFREEEKVTIPSIRELLDAESGEKTEKTEEKEQETEAAPAVSEAAAEERTEGRKKGPLDVSDVVETVMPSIVAITSETVQVVESYFYGTYEIPEESAGSGIIIGQNDEELLVATNYHVVEDADSLTVCFSVEEDLAEEALVSARIKGTDSSRDLAVVAVKTEEIPETVREQIAAAQLGDSDEVTVGEKAIAIGNALGYGQSVTAGIISAQNRELTIDKTTQAFLQTDAAINFGNSGGALLNGSGQVIGINSAKAASEGVEGMGYAIPINDAKPILEKLMKRKTREKAEEAERGSLGAELRNVSEEAQELYGISAGAFVYRVMQTSALTGTGISQGDIITEFDENRIGSAEELKSLLNYYRAGETVSVVYETAENGSYQEKTAQITLVEEAETQTEQYSPYPQGGDGFRFWNDDWWSF